MIHALIIFQLHPVHGWRVDNVIECGIVKRPLPLHRFGISHNRDYLGIFGTFSRRPRRGSFCKRPHKEIVHA